MSGHGEPKLNEQEAPLKRCTRFNQKAGLPITAKGATFKGEIGAGEKTHTEYSSDVEYPRIPSINNDSFQ